MTGKKLIAVSILVCLLGYYLYTPFPSNAVEPWKQRLVAAVSRIIIDTGLVCEAIGIASLVNTSRALTEVLFKVTADWDDGSLEVTNTVFDGITVRIYRPVKLQGVSPALIYIHGGGWTFLSIDTYDTLTKRISKSANIPVISIEYRRAPEHPYPAAFEDCITAIKYFLRHAHEYSVDPQRIGIAGDSAGGNLAMGISLKLSKEPNSDLPKFKMLGLIYPALQVLDLDTPAYRVFTGRNSPSFITKELVTGFYLYYGVGNLDNYREYYANDHNTPGLQSEYRKYVDLNLIPDKLKKDYGPRVRKGNEDLAAKWSDWLLNPDISPLLASDEELKKLPPTYLLTVEYDALRDDGWILANRMKNINHPIQHKDWEGIEHGFIFQTLYSSSLEFVKHFTTYLNAHL